ncbi:MAG TPA: hypothetical protein VKB11_03555 [Acidimicrobiia bacterium]|nr:hypothetical protein [Acidimicrobiia bacterium]
MAEYTQTHVAPTEGLPAWNEPDGSVAPAANLDAGLDVMLLERRGEWARIRCSNGWEAWVDGRRLIHSAPAPVTAPTPAPPPPQPAPEAPGPPSAARGEPGAGAAPPGVPHPTGGVRIGAGPIVALVGGILYFVAAWFAWLRFEFTGAASVSESFSAYDIPGHFLLDSGSEAGGLSLGIVIAFFGFACIATAVLSTTNNRLGILTVIAGVAALLVVVLFLIQTANLIDQLPRAFETGYFSVVRFAAYIALIGAIGSVVGGILSMAQRRS